MSRPVAYGQAFGSCNNIRVRAAASQPWQANSGKFVHLATTSRLATLASGKNTLDLVGWAEVGTYSSSSTVGQDVIAVNVAADSVYEMPINATQSETQLKELIGKVCDIETSGNIQYANYDAATDVTLQIVDYKYYGSKTGEQSLLVRLSGRQTASITATSVL